MSSRIYRYTFIPALAFEDVEASLVLAILATECLHGESHVRLDAAHAVAPEKRTCVVDGSTRVGQDLNRIFVGLLRHEFGEHAFRVHRVARAVEPSAAA
jgi:hypothetical protein